MRAEAGEAPGAEIPQGLVFYPDSEPGIARQKCGRGFTYRMPDGTTLNPGQRAFALAAVVLLIDKLGLRIGSASYATENGSYGALTLRRKHLKLTASGLQLAYTAKGSQKVRRRITNAKLMKTLETARDMPGAELISWVDDAGHTHSVGSEMLNGYIAEHTGAGFSAKTFRTWAGTHAAFEAREAGVTTIKGLAEAAAKRLKNTPSVARNSYIHPDVIALTEAEMPDLSPQTVRDLSASERRLLAFLTR